jgi:hypothetical protein
MDTLGRRAEIPVNSMPPDGDSQNQETKGKVYCANCAHCLVFKQPIEIANAYVLRVRCSKGMWKKKSGEDKVYKYFSIVRRTMDHCDCYDPMGDEKAFIKELRKNLPVKDEIYSYATLHQQEQRSGIQAAPR